MKHVVFSLVLLTATLARAADRYSILHQLDKGANDGSNQESIAPLFRGNTLYALTRSGGTQNKGTLFRLNADGSDPKLLHEFGSTDTDGQKPCGSLVADDNSLYGMTSYGGNGNGRNGAIFQLGLDGSNYKILHNFEGWFYNGDTPYGSLILDAGKLYGLTPRGGSNDVGVIFRLNKDATGFTLLYTFLGGRTDGANPYGSLVADDVAFYGMTSAGGNRNKGVLFRLNKDGSDYKILHHFTGGFDSGSTPFGSLLLHGDTLYGMTHAGGAADQGVIFSVRTDGSHFRILYSFPSHGADGSHPNGGLVLHSDTLYGVTRSGGRNGNGVLFSLKTDGKRFTVLRRFADPSALRATEDGAEPYGRLTLHQDALYGLTRRGGKNGSGILFRYQLTSP